MKCVSINQHDYATRAYGDPTADAALNRITTDGRTQVVRYA